MSFNPCYPANPCWPVTAPSDIPIGTIDKWGRVWDGIRWRCPTGVPEAPADGRLYGRENQTWQLAVAAVNGEATNLTVDGLTADTATITNLTTTGITKLGPIIGVTDGSSAAAGQVGEYIETTAQLGYPAYPGTGSSDLVLGTLQPGDWDCRASMLPGTEVGGANFYLAPQPPGFSNRMLGIFGGEVTGGSFIDTIVVNSQGARANITVPTQIVFFGEVIQATDSSLPAGTANLVFQARRMR